MNPIERALERADEIIRWDIELSTPKSYTEPKLVEDVDYERTGWRLGQVAASDNEPRIIRLDVDKSNAHLQAVGQFRSELRKLWWDDLSDEGRAEYHAAREAAMQAEAREWYARQPKGSLKSFWD